MNILILLNLHNLKISMEIQLAEKTPNINQTRWHRCPHLCYPKAHYDHRYI
jgi:hypothetical protein